MYAVLQMWDAVMRCKIKFMQKQRNILSCTITKVWVILITQWSLSDYDISDAENLMIGIVYVVKLID